MTTISDEGTKYSLAAQTELRIEVSHLAFTSNPSSTGKCNVRLLSGSAEIFGIELAQNKWYSFSGQKFAVFTWHGAELEVKGEYDVLYESDETSCNISYVNTHAQLEVMRDEALQAAMNFSEDKNDSEIKSGPRVLVAGAADSGKTSVTKILAAYAAKLSRAPILVDLDASNNLLSVPGCISAAPITADALSVTHWIDSSKIAPLVYWYGTSDVMQNTELFTSLVTKLSQSIDARMKQDIDNRTSGCIVNTTGSLIEGAGYELLLEIISLLSIDVILITGHDRLHSMLKSHYKTKLQSESSGYHGPKIIKLPRSGGVVSRNDQYRRIVRSSAIRKYFYGDLVAIKTPVSAQQPQKNNAPLTTCTFQFSPAHVEIDFSEISVYKTSKVSLSKNLLTIAGTQLSSKVQLDPVNHSDFGANLIHILMAVCHPAAVDRYKKALEAASMAENSGDSSGSDPDDLRTQAAESLFSSSVAGFVVVEAVDTNKQRLTLLSPCSGDLPSRTFITGGIAWME